MPFITAIAEDSYRPGSEDRVRIQVRGETLLIVVADGVGGKAGGGAAAELAVRRVLEHQELHDELTVAALLATIDQEIQDDPDAGETTIVIAVVGRSRIFGASVGDSGALLVTQDGCEELTAEQQRRPMLGTSCAIPIPFVRFFSEGTLVVASDGLLNYASQERIAEQTRGADLNSVAKSLVDLVRLRSGALQDDIAVALCRRT